MLSRNLCERRRRAGCHSCPAGALLLSPMWAQLSLIPARPLFTQQWPLCFTGENVVFVCLRCFIPVLSWWGHAGEGLPGKTQSLAAEGQGPALSPFLRLVPCVGCTKLSASSRSLQITLCWGWRGNSGQTVAASLFLKIAFVNIFSLILI